MNGRALSKAIWPTARKSVGALREAKPDAVMHFAANALVGESMQNPSKYFRNNIGERLESARRHGRRQA